MPLLLPGERSLSSDCISFSSIPHTTRLFQDYLSFAPAVRPFYPHPPDADHAIALAKTMPRDLQRQARVAHVLERQNRAWGASEATLRNIEKLRNGAFAFVTGQQTGLFGGPLLSLMKAASVLALAKKAQQAGVECVPVFWMASEDHDLAEVNQARLLTHEFALESFTAPTEGVEGTSVAAIRFAAGTNDVVAKVAEVLGESNVADWFRQSYSEGESFSNAFAKLYARIFAEQGLILLDPSDAELHRIAAPLLVEAVRRAEELDLALLARNKQLTAANYHEQVKVTERSSALFAVVEGARVVVQRANGGFKIGRESVAADELARRVEQHPEQFNANVLLRPVMQDYMLPTLAYIGGPAEVAYFAQVGVMYEKLLGRVTPVLPRLSATLIEPRIQRLLTQYGLKLEDVFHGEQSLRDQLAARTLPTQLKADLEQARAAVEDAIRQVSGSLAKLDPTLVEAATRSGNKMRYQVNRLERRAAQAQARREQVLSRHATEIENALYPGKELQERALAGIGFYAARGPELIARLVEAAEDGCPEHQVLALA